MRKRVDAIKVGDRLHDLRKEKGFTQEQLAEEIGVSTKSISNYERGAKLFSLETLTTLSTTLGTTTDDILCLTTEDVDHSTHFQFIFYNILSRFLHPIMVSSSSKLL